MITRGSKRRMASISAAVALALGPIALSASPAHAQPVPSLDKSHEGNFTRGVQGVYTITLTNTGDEDTGTMELTDNLPTGLTVAGLRGNLASACSVLDNGETISCVAFFIRPSQPRTLIVTVNIADNAPCSVTNSVRVEEDRVGSAILTDSDPTTITGAPCDEPDEPDEDGAGSVLPINLSGILPMFNNINTQNAINSPNATNASSNNFGLNTP
ncbi:hypothetical protein [Streptomyces sp. NPDC012888]|uniref:hypothetical protein n=1 Tax=Streptomyces sp. NPDC012888 TaxID=3364855 RepID=UPI0036CDED12